jgi:F0F1-type ATP synthase assembly protein I
LKPPTTVGTRRNTATDTKIGKGIDVALVTLVFLGVGYMLDRWLGTKPLLTITFVVLALVGEFVRFWYDYDARMKVLEAQRAEGLRSPSSRPSSTHGDRP